MFQQFLLACFVLIFAGCQPSKPSAQKSEQSPSNAQTTDSQNQQVSPHFPGGASRGIASRGIATPQNHRLQRYFFLLPEQRRQVFPQETQSVIAGGLAEVITDAESGECNSADRVVRNLCQGLMQGLSNGDCGVFENRDYFSMCMAYTGYPGSGRTDRLTKLKLALNQAQRDSADGVCDLEDPLPKRVCDQIVGATVNICLGSCNNGCHALRSLASSRPRRPARGGGQVVEP